MAIKCTDCNQIEWACKDGQERCKADLWDRRDPDQDWLHEKESFTKYINADRFCSHYEPKQASVAPDHENQAAEIARRIFRCGDEFGDTVQRIQFKGGTYPDSETNQGGMCEKALSTFIAPIIRDASAEITAERDALVEALTELVSLKSYKDQHGKDGPYLARQPAAWAAAREVLANIEREKSDDQTRTKAIG